MSDIGPGPDPAKARFAVIQLARLFGVVLVLLGVLIQAGRIAALAWVPQWAGYVLIAVGLVDTFVMPTLLARRWRSPKE
jgi:hypothetical protein